MSETWRVYEYKTDKDRAPTAAHDFGDDFEKACRHLRAALATNANVLIRPPIGATDEQRQRIVDLDLAPYFDT